MITMKAKNWAPYYESLKSDYQEYDLKLKAVFDPYEQWRIKEVLTLLQKIMNEYISYLKRIGSDNGVEFLKYLENEVNILSKMPKNEVYNVKLNIAVKAFRDFKKFRTED